MTTPPTKLSDDVEKLKARLDGHASDGVSDATKAALASRAKRGG